MATTPTQAALVGSGDMRLTGEGQQTAPAAAALANGGYVIAWLVTGAGGSSEVHAQRYDAGGAKLGGELLVNQGPAFGTPGLVTLPDGGFVATWDSRVDHTAPTNYMARRFDAGGNAVGNQFQANAVGNRDHAASAEPVGLASGGFLVQWWANPGGPTFWGPTVQLYGANGAPLGGNTALGYEADGTPFGSGTYIHATATAPTNNGGYASVWATATAYQPGVGATDHIYLQRFDGAGRALANPTEVITTASASFLVNGAEIAALAGSGDLVISLRGLLPDGRTQITAQRFDQAGTPLSGVQSMVLAESVIDYEVTALAGGGFLVSWLQWQGEQQALSAQRFDAAGAKVGEQVLVGTAAALYASYSVTATRDGGAVFAWDDGRLDSGDVYAERFTAPGGDLPPPPGPGVVLVGTAGPDNLVGTAGDDRLSGGEGRDVLTGLAGNDILDGGPGLDTAVHTGARGSYAIERTASGLTVSGPEGVDSLIGIGRLKFADVSLAMDVQGSAGQSYRLYQAAFDRAPDTGGLGFWMKSMDDGGLALVSVAQYFMDSPEFSTRYGSLDTPQFVTQLYANVLHRGPDEGGRDYWIGHLNQGNLTRAETLTYFSESAENQAALIGVIENGMTYLP